MVLGTGRLNWDRRERISDRYGTVTLYKGDSGVPIARINEGHQGTLFAKILETCKSTHIGDLFHGFFPETPEVGELIELGKGKLFYINEDTIGLEPSDGREEFWLDPKALYRCHDQTVELIFERED